MGAPFHLVNNRSFSTVLPSISTLRTHSEPILNRSAFWCLRYSCRSCTQSAPILMHRRERFVLGEVNTVPLPGMYCKVRSMEIVPASKSTSDQRRPQISPRRAPVNKASCVMTLNCVGASCKACNSRATSNSSRACTSISSALGASARLQGFSGTSPHCTAFVNTLDNIR